MVVFIFFVFLFCYYYSSLATATTIISTNNRRVLHEPFFPLDSPPPSQPPTPSPPSPTEYPFQGSIPPPPPDDDNKNNNDNPFFPTYPSPPAPPLPPPDTTSVPANVSSIMLPTTSKSKPVSSKLIVTAVISVIAAVLVLAIVIFLHIRKRRKENNPKPQRSDSNSIGFNGDNDNKNDGNNNNNSIPKLERPSQTSSEFLYLGTLVNSHGSSVDTHNNNTNIRNNSSNQSPAGKMESPELHPLPPLLGRNARQNYGHTRFFSGTAENDVDFYSSAGSMGGRESSIGGGSLSRRDFAAVEVDKFGGCSSSSSSSSSSSGSGSPVRSVSLSISPPASLSPKRENLRAKSPELVAVDTAPPPQYPPPPPPLPRPTANVPPFVESPSPSPSLSPRSSLSPERYSTRSMDSSPGVFNLLEQDVQFPGRIRNHIQHAAPASVPPPPRPPPPPPPRLPKNMEPVLEAPLRPIGVERPVLVSAKELPSISEHVEKNDEKTEEPKPKLKTLHWDKVRASSDREMVWDQLKSSSFKLNEEMIETLFVVKTPTSNTNDTARRLVPSPNQENRVLDPKKAQNIAILLRALNVTTEEICEALLEGNAEIIGTELLEILLKMAPSKEEERKLKEYKDDSPFKLGPAEKFLKAMLDIPFAFQRVDAMLYISNFDYEVDYLRKSFETLEAACEELRSSRMFLKLLEAVLKTGNRMNVGTNRGDAHAFKLDTLLKLVDVKGADGKTTLLHFVIQEIIKGEGARLSGANQNKQSATNDDAECRKLGLQVVSNISSELMNVKNAAAMDSEVLHSDLLKLSKGIRNIAEVVGSIEAVGLEESSTKKFSESMNRFMNVAEEKIVRLQAQETLAMSLVKEITEYFHGDSAREEAHPFRTFMVVKDFLVILDRVCKEVGMINERTIVSSAHKFPVPVNPNQQPVTSRYTAKRQHSSSSDEEYSSA
ncbi:Formin-like protein 1 [Capsicum annuum]|uniref:formin-like protein 1 n=1 Tax=Capsicum annuum TaxID=4072 RepID=UPI001FB1565C|nr:formin-like protein 1 [Capsicum annuum]KAF3652507.1 Formin-like protein 1 [Capsicum annuum]